MNLYKEIYFNLFSRTSDAIEEIASGKYEIAMDTLKNAQIECEEKVMECENCEKQI